MDEQLASGDRAELSKGDILSSFADFLRLNVAQGDASPQTVRAHHARAVQYMAWYDTPSVWDPATAVAEDLEAYRQHLVAGRGAAKLLSH